MLTSTIFFLGPMIFVLMNTLSQYTVLMTSGDESPAMEFMNTLSTYCKTLALFCQCIQL